MGLYIRGSVWWMSFTYHGEQFRRSTETEDKKLALRIFDKLKGEIAEGKWFEKPPGDGYKFKDLMDKYMTEYSKVNKAASSHRRDKSITDNLVGVFGGMYLTEITPAMISDYKVKRRTDGVSPRTINYELTTMSHAFNIATREWGLTSNNPVKKVKKYRVFNNIERWLTLEEEGKLLKTSPKWLQEIISFAINTGFRQSEILNLKWPQVDLFRKTITILEQKNQGKDTLPLNETIQKILKKRFKSRPINTDYVFYSNNFKRINARNLMRAFYSATKKAGINCLRFHDLRHTFATRLVQAGVDIYMVQKLGRWRNISMVMRYAHHYSESLRSGILVLDKLSQIYHS